MKKKRLNKDQIVRTLLKSISNDALFVHTPTLDKLFAEAANKDGLYIELVKMQHHGLVKLNRATGAEQRYNIISLQLTPKGLAYFDDKKEANRLTRQQLRYAIISGVISSFVGAILGWILSCVTLG